jgi:cation:H+ antiporter
MDAVFGVAAGLALLLLGGELLVRGAVRVAERLGISPLLIGLTLVGFGTSTPELVTSLQAALAGSPGIAVGNAVGSNIANILLILGLAAAIAPMAVGSAALRRDGVVMVGAAVLFLAAAWGLGLTRAVGFVFLAGLGAYLWYAILEERAAKAGHTAAFEKAEAYEGVHPNLHARGKGGIAVQAGVAIGGLVLVVLGARLLVDGAVGLARGFGISETVIGLTIVAIGTSAPELVTSLVAAARRQSDVALGNVLGSNIYNMLGILGVTGLVAPVAVPGEILRFDGPVMLGVSLLLFAFAWTGMRVGRREGGVLLAGYAAYIWWLWPA